MRRNEQSLASPREISSRSASAWGDAAARSDDMVDRSADTPQGTTDVSE